MNLQEAAKLLGVSPQYLLSAARNREMLPTLISLAYNKGIEDSHAPTHAYYHKVVEPRERQLDESRDKLYALTKPE